MTGDVRSFVERYPVCQMEKSDHTLSKGKLQSTQIPETKWSDISIDFGADLPKSSRNRDSILVVGDKATRKVRMGPYGKGINAISIARLLWNIMVKLRSAPRVIYSDKGSQFTAESWTELWWLTRTKLAYSIAYHPQPHGVVERMNSVIEQCMRCIIHESRNINEWENILSTVELVINSLLLCIVPGCR